MLRTLSSASALVALVLCACGGKASHESRGGPNESPGQLPEALGCPGAPSNRSGITDASACAASSAECDAFPGSTCTPSDDPCSLPILIPVANQPLLDYSDMIVELSGPNGIEYISPVAQGKCTDQGGFYFDPPASIAFCPCSCTRIGLGKIEILYGCSHGPIPP